MNKVCHVPSFNAWFPIDALNVVNHKKAIKCTVQSQKAIKCTVLSETCQGHKVKSVM